MLSAPFVLLHVQPPHEYGSVNAARRWDGAPSSPSSSFCASGAGFLHEYGGTCRIGGAKGQCAEIRQLSHHCSSQ